MEKHVFTLDSDTRPSDNESHLTYNDTTCHFSSDRKSFFLYYSLNKIKKYLPFP